MKANLVFSVVTLVVAVAACGPAPTGSLTLKASGEAGAVDGFPFTEDGETVEIADGWTVRFSKVVASISHVDVKGADGEAGVHDMDGFVVDLHKAEEVVLGTYEALPARRWEQVGFKLVAPGTAAKNVNDVAVSDVEALKSAGASLLVEGTATKGEAGFSFRWLMPVLATYSDCTNGTDGTQGIVVAPSANAEAQLTLHLDHLFWTSLGSEESALYFGAIAAKASENAISFDALATQSLAQPLDAQGQPVKDADGNNLVYNPGSASPAPTNVKEFILESASRMPHLNGGGLCTVAKN